MVQNKNESATRLYDLLEVEKTATAAQIKTSYKKLALVSVKIRQNVLGQLQKRSCYLGCCQFSALIQSKA